MMKIGSLNLQGNVLLAPMAGFTDPPFRRIVQRFGVSALWTELISAHALTAAGKAFRTMDLTGHRVPTGFQIYGTHPELMAEAARRIQDMGAAFLDINMGCPVKKVVRQGGGAALLQNPPLIAKIVAAVRKVLTIPLTVKIRSGWHEDKPIAPSVARILEQEGADAVVVHARSRAKGHSGPVSLEILAQVKRAVQIPVIGNGGIFEVADARNMIDNTGCDGVMIGRGALGRPWIPGRILRALFGGPQISDNGISLFQVIRDHFQYQLEMGDGPTGIRLMRKQLVWYSKGVPGASLFRRKALVLEDPVQIIDAVEEFFGKVTIP